MISVPGPIIISMLGCVSGFPDFPILCIKPFLIPISDLNIPLTSTTRAFVITVSTAPSSRVTWDCPIPSLITFPPPNLTSSP